MGNVPKTLQTRLGGLVVAKSVKELKDLGSKKKTELKRDKWWAELRSEVRGHARALCCNCVLGYEETVTMYEETAVLTASGTAVYLKPVNKRDYQDAERKMKGEISDR